MSNSGYHFRTVAFGGFHKQDVLNYITMSSKERQEQDSNLIISAECARKELDELREKYETAEAARRKYVAECERVSDALTQRTNALEQLERELAVLREEHGKMSARLSELDAVLPKLEADSEAYSQLKDHTATIEMEAHRKAQEILEQAQSKADQLRTDMESWLRRVQGTYQHLRTDLSATVTHLSGEIERGQKALAEAGGALRQHDETLAALLESEGIVGSAKVPEPLPLEE